MVAMAPSLQPWGVPATLSPIAQLVTVLTRVVRLAEWLRSLLRLAGVPWRTARTGAPIDR